MKIKARLEPGKIAIVTGGSSGIGKAIACQLAEKGMDVWLVAQRKDILETARKEVEGHRLNSSQKIGIVSADISELNQARMVVEHVSEMSGPTDLLVNSAGVTHPGYIQDLDISIFQWMMEVNYFGTVYMTKEVLPAMMKRGSGYLLNISSLVGAVSGFGYSAYGASKSAVRGFSEALRMELVLHGIGTSIVYPSDTDTPQLEYENRFKPFETKALANLTGAMTAEDVAKVIVRGIERGRFKIIPALEGKFWIRLNELSADLVNFIADKIVADAVKKNNSAISKEA